MGKLSTFENGEMVVHPAHGVGHISCIESQWVSDCEFKVFVVSFLRERLTMRVPIGKAGATGLRRLSSITHLEDALVQLKSAPSLPKKMAWSRRAQEYTNKINSGDLVALAEVIRDLGSRGNLEAQSFSEKQLYHTALERFLEEWTAIRPIEKESAHQQVMSLLAQIS